MDHSRKEDSFTKKFKLLIADENLPLSQDIFWSSSSSDDLETSNVSGRRRSISNNVPIKRKKRRKKAKPAKNNLALLTVLDNQIEGKKSPILTCTSIQKETSLQPRDFEQISPILKPSQQCYVYKNQTYGSVLNREENTINSPVLQSKVSKYANTSFKKKLKFDNSPETSMAFDVNRLSPIIMLRSEIHAKEKDCKKQAVINKVKTFLDIHFSSQSSQHSISDTPTPKNDSPINECLIEIDNTQSSKSSEKNTIQNETNSKTVLLKQNSDTTNSNSENVTGNQKKKFKKGSLQHRLQELVKKENSSICLWQHERFLAAKLDFALPKNENYKLFRVKSCCFDYSGCLIEGISLEKDEKYLISLNNSNTKNVIFKTDTVLQVYDPFLEIKSFIDDCKLIVNVCKYQCIDFKKDH